MKTARLLAIGDIHGCFTALQTLLDFVPVIPGDLLVTLGDYVDRGPESRAVLSWLCRRSEAGTLQAVRGNHDLMMLRAREDPEFRAMWLAFGGDTTLASYAAGSGPGTLEDVPEEHWRFLEATRPWYETETHFFVHANVDPVLDLAEQSERALFWETFDDPSPHCSGKIMVCGHTSQKSGRPLSVGHAVCIDTWVYGDGWLTCLDVHSGEFWQANDAGETRRDQLSLGGMK